ncbi:MAG: PTS cellobiose transporter subunit IIB [Erysipelotrichaceae bacterium]
MKKVLIICIAGMSSSMMASKLTKWFKDKNIDIFIDSIIATGVNNITDNSDFDLFLLSPQTKLYFDKYKTVGERLGKTVISISPQVYVPIPSGIEQMAKLISDVITL